MRYINLRFTYLLTYLLLSPFHVLCRAHCADCLRCIRPKLHLHWFVVDRGLMHLQQVHNILYIVGLQPAARLVVHCPAN